MKKVLMLAFVLFTSISVFAQEKTIEKAEFEAVRRNSFRVSAGLPYRETRTSESSFEVIPQPNYPVSSLASLQTANTSFQKSITESVPGVGFRMIFEINTPSLYKKTETIRIADKTYKREGNGEWIVEAPVERPKSESTSKTIDKQIEYKSLGTVKLDNKNANAYITVETSKLVNLKTNAESLSVMTTKYWFAEDGRLIRSEGKREIRGEKSIGKFNDTTIYEVDPNIKIEAPIK